MSNTYYIESTQQANGQALVLDIKEPVASGSAIQILNKKTEANQRWTFSPLSDLYGYFYIVSAEPGSGGTPLVLDIKEPVASGSTIQILNEKPEANQQWLMVVVSAGSNSLYLVSAQQMQTSTGQEEQLVLSIEEPIQSGSLVQALSVNNEPSQQWTIVPAPGCTFFPRITSFLAGFYVQAHVEYVLISGTGFLPGATFFLGPYFKPPNSDATYRLETIQGNIQLDGTLTLNAPLSALGLNLGTGTFYVIVETSLGTPDEFVVVPATATWTWDSESNSGSFSGFHEGAP